MGWHENVKEQLSKVKPISNIIIRDEQDIYNILTNREKLEYLFQEYVKKNSHRLANEEEQLQICCDENTPCVPNIDDSNIVSSTSNTSESLVAIEGKVQNEQDYTHKGENGHSNKKEEESDNEKLISNLKAQIKDKLEEYEKEQQILLKENKQNIIDFLVNNKDSIKIEDIKTYEPIYKCYLKKENCDMCNSLSNIVCTSCKNNYNNREVWLCTNHWQKHAREKHKYQI